MSLFRTLKNCLMSAFRISYFPHNYPLANNMPLLRNNMPLSHNKDGLLRIQNKIVFSLKKVVILFGCFSDFLYLCNVVQERTAKGGKGHPMQMVR